MAQAAPIVTKLLISAASLALAYALAPDQKIKGQRLDSLLPRGVDPGAPIPEGYGATVLPGQVIYDSGLKETRKVTTESAKGGPSVTTEEFTYAADLAIAFSATEIDHVSRILANKVPIYQTAPAIDSELITAEAELAYITAYDRQYDFFIAAGYAEEIARSAAEQAGEDARAAVYERAGVADGATGRLYDDIEIYLGTEDQMPSAILEAIEGAGEVPAFRGIAYVVLKNLQLAQFGNSVPAFEIEINGDAYVQATGAAVLAPEIVSTIGDLLPDYSGAALHGVAYNDPDDPFGDMYTITKENALSIYGILGGGTDSYYFRCGAGSLQTARGNLRIDLAELGLAGYTQLEGRVRAQASGTNVITRALGASVSIVKTNGDSLGIGDSYNVGSITGNPFPWLDLDSGYVEIPPGETSLLVRWGGGQEVFLRDLRIYLKGGQVETIVAVRPTVGGLIRSFLTDWKTAASPYVEDDSFAIDASLDALEIAGIRFTDNVTPRDRISALAAWSPFEMTFSDGLLAFRPRFRDTVATLNAQDYGAAPDGKRPRSTAVVNKIIDDQQLPGEIRVSYIDPGRGFSVNAEALALGISRSTEIQTIDTNITGTPSEAAQAANAIASGLIAASRQREVDLPIKYFILEPGDPIDMPDGAGRLTASIVTARTLAPNMLVRLTAEDDLGDVRTAPVILKRPITPFPDDRIATPTIAEVLDLPRLSDDAALDDGAQLLVTGAAAGLYWPGAALYKDTASDGSAFGGTPAAADFEIVGAFAAAGAIGQVLDPAETDIDPGALDRVSALAVVFQTLAPGVATLSDAAFARGLDNVFAVGSRAKGWEILQARDIEISDRGLIARTLKRGMRGTEWAVGQMAAGDKVVWLDPEVLARQAITAGEIGRLRTFRAVTAGLDLTTAADLEITPAGVQNKAFAPGLARAYRASDGAITVTLDGRAQQATAAGAYVLEGALEAFEVDILDGPGGAVLRTLSASATDSLTYSAAAQTSDFGAPELGISAIAYQIGPDGARGYGRTITL